jgi:hypothetical protein
MGGACGMYAKEKKCTQVLVGKAEGKRTTGRSRHRRKNNIKMDLKAVWAGDIWLSIRTSDHSNEP